MSINRIAAGITSNLAAASVFDQTLTGSVIGTGTVEQENAGFDLPNVQAALDDIWKKAPIQPGQIALTMSATSPSVSPSSVSSQVTKVTVTGTPTTGNLTIAGFAVAILSTDTTTQIAGKIQAVLVAQTSIFSSVTTTTNTVTYTYVGTGAHPVDNNTQLGLTIATTTTTFGGTPGYLGYGSWELLGSETKYTRTLYTWLRIA